MPDTYIAAGVDVSFQERIENNTKRIQHDEKTIRTVKMDEIATETRLRWCNVDNKVLGLCHQHGHNSKLSLNTIEDAPLINEQLESEKIHKTKETLVVATGEVGNGGKAHTVLTLPTCSKTVSLFVSEKLTPDVIATDGDAMRRKVFNGRDKLIRERNIITELEKLPLFYLHIIDGA